MVTICSKDNCTGCGACRQACPKAAITMIENNKGHVYPIVDQNLCIDCNLCQKICPSVQPVKANTPIIVYAGWNKDKEARHNSTSGGVSYALSKWIVIEGGWFCGVQWDSETCGTKHTLTNSCDDLLKYQGSRYSHSDTGDVFVRIKELLKSGQKVLFSGTPCQVAGLKSFLRKDYDNLFTVELICHGVPSRKILRERIESVEKIRGKRVINLKSREKTPNQYFTSMKYLFDDGSSDCISVYKDFFFRGFVENYFLRDNCFNCQYSQEKRVADITIGDFWGYEPHSLKDWSYKKGTSVIIVNTIKGERMLNSIKHYMRLEPRTFRAASSCNRNLSQPQAKPVGFDCFWKKYLNGDSIDMLAAEYFPPKEYKITLSHKVKTFLKMILPISLIKKAKQ